MENVFLKKILSLIFLVIMFFALITIFSFYIPYINKNYYWLALRDKHEILKGISGPRMIYIGGSNLMYGLDSALIEKELKMPVINLGLHAGLGLRFILTDISNEIRSNDIIMLSPEYQFFLDKSSTYGEYSLMQALFVVYPEGFKKLDFMQSLHLITFLPQVVINKLRFSILAYLRKSLNIPQPLDYAYRDGFNQYGDYIKHLNQDYRGSPPIPYDNRKSEVNMVSIKFANEFYKMVLSKGAKMYMIHPPYQKRAYEMNDTILTKLNEEFNHSLKIPIISKAKDYLFEDNFLLDSPYHLNKVGREIRTRRVIQDYNNKKN